MKDKTMDEEYRDGSDHIVCEKCGFCKTCSDCDKCGCGDNDKKSLKGLGRSYGY